VENKGATFSRIGAHFNNGWENQKKAEGTRRCLFPGAGKKRRGEKFPDVPARKGKKASGTAAMMRKAQENKNGWKKGCRGSNAGGPGEMHVTRNANAR